MWGRSFKLAEKYFAAPVVMKGLHGGGHGTHPRMEVKGMSEGVGDCCVRMRRDVLSRRGGCEGEGAG